MSKMIYSEYAITAMKPKIVRYVLPHVEFKKHGAGAL